MSFNLLKIKSEKKNASVQKPEVTFAPTNVFRQSFRYPRTLINYFKTHPTTPELHVNLLKSCKYFYSKTDLFIPLDNYDRYVISEIVSTKKEAAKYTIPFKIWFIHILGRYETKIWREYYLSKSSARCRFKEIHLDREKITFEEFKILTENGLETLECRGTTIMYENGNVVPVETIFANLKKIKYVHYIFEEETAKLVTKETAENLTKIIDTSQLNKFLLSWIPSAFDFETFKKFTDAHLHIRFGVTRGPHCLRQIK